MASKALAKLYAKRLGQKDSPIQDLQDIQNEELRAEVKKITEPEDERPA